MLNPQTIKIYRSKDRLSHNDSSIVISKLNDIFIYEHIVYFGQNTIFYFSTLEEAEEQAQSVINTFKKHLDTDFVLEEETLV